MSSEIVLTEEQETAVSNALSDRSHISIITGSPGSGKTETVKEIVRRWLLTSGVTVILCAPTGKATQVIARVMRGSASPMTIAKLIEDRRRGKFRIPARLFMLVDESSMVSTECFTDLMSAVNPDPLTIESVRNGPLNPERLVLVGDSNQLSPVGDARNERSFFETLVLQQKHVPCVRLTRLHRFESPSLRHNVEHFDDVSRYTDFRTDADFVVIADAVDHRRILHGINAICVNCRLPAGTQFLCATNATRVKLNAYLQDRINNVQRDLKSYGSFRLDDPIICTENLYEKERLVVANGTMGRLAIEESSDKVYPHYANGFVDCDRRSTFELSYVITIAKSQGDQFDRVVVICDFQVPDRALLYTAMSRARKRCTLLGSGSSIDACLRRSRKRPSHFEEELEKAFIYSEDK